MTRWGKGILKTLIALCVVVAVFTSITAEKAEAACAPSEVEYPTGSGVCLKTTGCPGGYAQDATTGNCTVNTRNQIGDPATNGVTTNKSPEPTFGCNSILGCSVLGLGARIAYWVMSLFGVLLGVAGMFLDFVINVTILNLPKFIKGLEGIRIGWQIIRDALNLVFIFILLYTAIQTIIGQGDYKKVITKIVMAGLLINFSFFFTSVAIDASNVLTIQVYKAIEKVGAGQATNLTDGSKLSGISAAFMKGLNPQKMFDTARSEGVKENYESHIFQQMVFGSIILLVATIIFFAMALMLVVRFITFIILLITSPIAFMNGLLPQLDSQAKKWKEALIGQAVFAPVLMFFMLTTVLIVNNKGFQDSLNRAKPVDVSGASAAIFDFVGGGVVGIVSYFIVIGLMVSGLIIAKQFSGSAGAGIVSWAQKATGAVTTGLARRAGGALGRNTVGRAASAIAPAYDRFAGRATRGELGAGMAASSNRFISSLGKSAQVATKIGATVGKYTGANALLRSADVGLRDQLESLEKSKFGGTQNRADVEKEKLERRKETGDAIRDKEREDRIKRGQAKAEELQSGKKYTTDYAETITLPDGTTKTVKPIEDFLGEVSRLSKQKIEEMLAHDIGTLKKKVFASALTAKQMEAINESSLITDSEKKAIADAREQGIRDRIAMADTSAKIAEGARIARMKSSDVAQLPIDILTNDAVAVNLSHSALGEILNNEKITVTQRGDIRQKVSDEYNNLLNKATAPGGSGLDPQEKERFARLEKVDKWFGNSDAGKLF